MRCLDSRIDALDFASTVFVLTSRVISSNWLDVPPGDLHELDPVCCSFDGKVF